MSGLVVEARRRFSLSAKGAGGSLRAAYTLSRLIDDGVVNTSSALRAGDFRGERARSLLDRRHRFALAATFDAPRSLGRLRLASVLRLASGAPFNVTLGGDDRNLDDVSNDRPSFAGDPRLIRWRRPGEPLDPRLVEAFRLPTLGRTGDLPRNAGRGPALFALALKVEREFRLSGRARLRPSVEFDNVLNRTTYTFGAEFISFDALRPGATDGQRARLRRHLPRADAHDAPAHGSRRAASGFLKGGESRGLSLRPTCCAGSRRCRRAASRRRAGLRGRRRRPRRWRACRGGVCTSRPRPFASRQARTLRR